MVLVAHCDALGRGAREWHHPPPTPWRSQTMHSITAAAVAPCPSRQACPGLAPVPACTSAAAVPHLTTRSRSLPHPLHDRHIQPDQSEPIECNLPLHLAASHSTSQPPSQLPPPAPAPACASTRPQPAPAGRPAASSQTWSSRQRRCRCHRPGSQGPPTTPRRPPPLSLRRWRQPAGSAPALASPGTSAQTNLCRHWCHESCGSPRAAHHSLWQAEVRQAHARVAAVLTLKKIHHIVHARQVQAAKAGHCGGWGNSPV